MTIGTTLWMATYSCSGSQGSAIKRPSVQMLRALSMSRRTDSVGAAKPFYSSLSVRRPAEWTVRTSRSCRCSTGQCMRCTSVAVIFSRDCAHSTVRASSAPWIVGEVSNDRLRRSGCPPEVADGIGIHRSPTRPPAFTLPFVCREQARTHFELNWSRNHWGAPSRYTAASNTGSPSTHAFITREPNSTAIRRP